MLLPTRINFNGIKLMQKEDDLGAPFEGAVLIHTRAGLSLPRRRQ
jgi:hypothetical protein